MPHPLALALQGILTGRVEKQHSRLRVHIPWVLLEDLAAFKEACVFLLIFHPGPPAFPFLLFSFCTYVVGAPGAFYRGFHHLYHRVLPELFISNFDVWHSYRLLFIYFEYVHYSTILDFMVAASRREKKSNRANSRKNQETEGREYGWWKPIINWFLRI